MAPTRKVTAAGGGGLIATALVMLAGKFGVDLSPEEAAIFASALAVVFGWFVKERE